MRKEITVMNRRAFLVFISFILVCLLVSVTIWAFAGGAPAAVEPSGDASPADTSLRPTPGVPSADESSEEPSLPEESSAIPTPGKTVVCIDPGHGFGDVGAQNGNLGVYDEKDINLAVSLKLRAKLEAKGISVIMTRSGDIAPGGDASYRMRPSERAAFANASGAGLYISLHCNSFTDSGVSGTRLYYYTGTNASSEAFAKSIAHSVSVSSGASPSLYNMTQETVYTVIESTLCPSVLVEMGFITNAGDAAKLTDPAWQDALAESIADGIAEYMA